MRLLFKKSLTIIPLLSAFFFAFPAVAAAPDGSGPWADNVVSQNQGLTANGLAVQSARSNPTSAVGVAENDLDDTHFFSLGFSGNITLGFDNGISSGVIVVESTFPLSPLEVARVEVSEDGNSFMTAGTVVQDGQVPVPAGITCARFVRITDISDPSTFPQDIHSDGYDVDGVQALGDNCNAATPSPAPTSSPAATPSATPATNPPPPPPPGPPPPPPPPSTVTVPGLPNAGGPPCTSNGIVPIPSVASANRTSPTSIFVSWNPATGFKDFVVRYGFQNGNWQFSTHATGLSTTINNLPIGTPIWIQIAATDNCATGTFGTAVLVGGTPSTNTPGFPNTGVPRLPNTGGPRLPNTGIDPVDNNFLASNNNIAWVIPVGVFLSLVIFYFTRKARKFSSK